MATNWRYFYRRTSTNHRLEAKIAAGGESYGHSNHTLTAKKGQWLCRNPENQHTWVMSEVGMEELYRPVNRDDEEWDRLVSRVRPKKDKKARKGTSDDATEKVSMSFNPSEAGPLFFWRR